MAESATTEQTPAAASPLPRIVIESGNPTPEEIAALLTLIAAASGGEADAAGPARTGWTRRSRTFNAGAVRGAGWGAGL